MRKTDYYLPRRSNPIEFFLNNPAQSFALALVFIIFIAAISVIITYFKYDNPVLSDGLFGKLLPSLIAASVILFIGLWTSTFSVQNVRVARDTARIQETLNMIKNTELNSEFIKAKNVWAKYRLKDDYTSEFAKLMTSYLLGAYQDETELHNEHDIDREKSISAKRSDAESIIVYFNFFELCSISMQRDIMDSDFFRAWYGTNFIRVWNYSVSAIGAMRALHGNERLFYWWEVRARLWADEMGVSIKNSTTYSIAELVKIGRSNR